MKEGRSMMEEKEGKKMEEGRNLPPRIPATEGQRGSLRWPEGRKVGRKEGRKEGRKLRGRKERW